MLDGARLAVEHGDPRARLATVARELACLDVQGGRPRGLAGGRGDRNARLFRAAPSAPAP